LGVEVPSHSTDLMESGLLDSLALVSLLAEIERAFGFELPLDTLEVDDFRTVESAAAYVEKAFAAGDPAA
jgi:acyl carrier protein